MVLHHNKAKIYMCKQTDAGIHFKGIFSGLNIQAKDAWESSFYLVEFHMFT